MSNFGGHLPIMPDERHVLSLRAIATGESFQSLSFQFRISVNAVSHIIKGCCNAFVDEYVFVGDDAIALKKIYDETLPSTKFNGR